MGQFARSRRALLSISQLSSNDHYACGLLEVFAQYMVAVKSIRRNGATVGERHFQADVPPKKSTAKGSVQNENDQKEERLSE